MTTVSTRKQVRQVLLTTLLLNLAVAAGKIITGLLTGALAITADGFHSLTDGAGNVAGLIGNYYAGKPPDAEHPYGHRRFETMAALLIGALLLLTAWEIVQSALERLNTDAAPLITPLTFLVLVVTLLINLAVSRYQRRAGHRLRSEVLLADARNTTADVYVTLSVIISTGLVAVTGWLWLDAVAALVVVVLIGRAALNILRETGSVLVDTAPHTPQRLVALVDDVPGIRQIVRARSRGTPDAAFIDIDVQVAGAMTAAHQDSIGTAIRDRLHRELTGIAEIEVHFESPPYPEQDAVLVARACADAMGLGTHEVRVYHELDGCTLEMHVEVPPHQTLMAAHEQVSQLETQVHDRLPRIDRVITHIEPAQTDITTEADRDRLAGQRALTLQTQANAALVAAYPAVDWHDLTARVCNGSCTLSLHATLPPRITVETAHHLAEDAEVLLRSQFPALSRVTIHTEPFDHG